ncbi:hypothetical protein CRG98_034244 [Punica granatum]|nr:hypothetical protein CRG98_034244 [Punica granatum]
MALSCNATSDHAVIWIERESQRALELMLEREKAMDIPASQRMERQKSIAREHTEEYKAALQKAVDLHIPSVYPPSSSQYGTFQETEEGENSSGLSGEASSLSSKKRTQSWQEFMERLFDVDDSGQMVFKKP